MGIRNRWRRTRHAGFANAPGSVAIADNLYIDLRHILQSQQPVAIEVGYLWHPIDKGLLAVKGRGYGLGHCTFNLSPRRIPIKRPKPAAAAFCTAVFAGEFG